MNRRTLLALPAPLPTIEVEELSIQEHIILREEDYSWYEFYGEQCLCIRFGCAADNNWDNPSPPPEALTIHGPYTVG